MKNLRWNSYGLTLVGLVSLGLFAVGAVAYAAVDAGDLCTEKKAKAAGKKAADRLKAYGKDAKKPNAGKLFSDLSKSESKFQKAFSKAEGKGSCATSGDADAIEAQVDALVAEMYRDIACTQETVTVPSAAEPARTPGSPGVDNADYPKLVTMFGGTNFSLNNATYTRYFCGTEQPEAILILIPGFEGGAGSFKILAENTLLRARLSGIKLEIWGFDRRGHQIEDREGMYIAQALGDPQVALDWYYGGELGLTLHPALAAGPNRRAEFHNAQEETAFIADWTELVISRDIDAVVEAARAAVVGGENVFLGGHSAGTGFTARYAATDFNLSGAGPAEPGYEKLRGLVLIEGDGSSTSGSAPTEEELDRIEDRADGGLFFAVRDNAATCVDGTPCTVATEAIDCAGKGKERCTEPTQAYAIVPGLLNPRILAASEPGSIQALTDPDAGQVIIQVDQGAPGNSAVAQVPDLLILSLLIPPATAEAALGTFLDDDGLISTGASFVRTSVGAPGPLVGGLRTWLDITEGPLPPAVLPNNGPPPTSLPAAEWGQEVEVTRLDRVGLTFITGETNFTDWYYPSSGLGTTGGIGLDSTSLSADPPTGRGRRDIENLTQAANVDIPVICFGGSNGLTSVPGDYVAFAQSIGICTAPSCDGTTSRVVDPNAPNEAFPLLGGVPGGFEVYISEGYAHIDIVTADNGDHNDVIGPLVDFLARNMQ